MPVKATREMLDLIRRAAIGRSVILILLAASAFPVLYTKVDIPAARYCRYELAKPIVKAARLTDSVDDYIIAAFIIGGAAAAIRKRRRNMVLFQKMVFPPMAAAVAGLTTQLFKMLFGRWRPRGLFKFEEYGFEWFSQFKPILASFPSGHASSIMAIMTAIVLLNVKPPWRPACYAIAVVLACMRIIVCAHYPSDVLAGIVQGYLTTLWLYYFLIRKGWHPAPALETDCFRVSANPDMAGAACD